MSYQKEREQFIVRMTTEGLPYQVILRLLREATGLNRRAELACSSEAADRDRVKCPAWEQRGIVVLPDPPRKKRLAPCLCDLETYVDPETKQPHPTIRRHTKITRITLQDWQAEERVRKALPDGWTFTTEGDPRGYTLRVIPPSYAERNQGKDRHNLDTIGVPAGPSGLRF